jgi:hypothetical protein
MFAVLKNVLPKLFVGGHEIGGNAFHVNVANMVEGLAFLVEWFGFVHVFATIFANYRIVPLNGRQHMYDT